MKLSTAIQVLTFSCLLTANGLQITVPEAYQSRAKIVAPDLVSFSIEQDGWLDWVGSSKRNEFFYNALDNLKQLAGIPPRIRVGGRSQDVTFLNRNGMGTNVVYVNSTPSVPYPEASSMWIGGDFYAAAKFLPENTRLTHALNFASIDDLRGFWQLATIVTTFDSTDVKKAKVTLDAIEVGNEPDMYGVKGPKSPKYGVSEYLGEWSGWATNVLAVEDVYYGAYVTFWGGALSRSSHTTKEWSPQALFDKGYRRSIAGERVSSFSQHHYTGSSCVAGRPELAQLVSKSNIRKALDAFKSDIHTVHEQGMDYVLGEVGSFSCHGAAGVSDTAAAALWALDYALYSSTIGVSRVFFHQGIGYKSNFLQPVPLTRSPVDNSPLPTPSTPHVNPQYYAAVVAAEAIGSTNNSRIVELSVEDTRVSAYLIYEGATPVRAVFINMHTYFPSPYGFFQTRSSVRIQLEVAGSAPYELKRLAIPYADAKSGLSWGGVTYETSSGRPSGEELVECIDPEEGFDIYATEAVLVYLN